MRKENQELIEALGVICDELYEKYGDSCPHLSVNFHSWVYTEVKFYWSELNLEFVVWNSENDDRYFYENLKEYEKFESVFRRKINESIEKIGKIKL